MVRRIEDSDADLATQAIRSIKIDAEPGQIYSLDSVDMKLWLKNPANVLIVAAETSHPVGFALGYVLDRIDRPRPMLCFYEIVVVPEYRKRGIGRQLVEAMKLVARDVGAVKMWVQTDPDNHAARVLYRHAGGIESASSNHVYSWPEEGFSNNHPASL